MSPSALYVLINVYVGKVFCNLRRGSSFYLFYFGHWLNVHWNLSWNKNHIKCFWDVVWLTVLLLQVWRGWFTSWACLLGSRLKLIFNIFKSTKTVYNLSASKPLPFSLKLFHSVGILANIFMFRFSNSAFKAFKCLLATKLDMPTLVPSFKFLVA